MNHLVDPVEKKCLRCGKSDIICQVEGKECHGVCGGIRTVDHNWSEGKCIDCGITQQVFLRSDSGADCPKTTQKLLDRIKNDFTYHHPTDKSQINKFETIRNRALDYAVYLTNNCPHGRELSLALTKLEEVVFWANASVARSK